MENPLKTTLNDCTNPPAAAPNGRSRRPRRRDRGGRRDRCLGGFFLEMVGCFCFFWLWVKNRYPKKRKKSTKTGGWVFWKFFEKQSHFVSVFFCVLGFWHVCFCCDFSKHVLPIGRGLLFPFEKQSHFYFVSCLFLALVGLFFWRQPCFWFSFYLFWKKVFKVPLFKLFQDVLRVFFKGTRFQMYFYKE